MTPTTRSRPGFTLIELMVALAIIGALFALAAPMYGKYRETAKGKACQAVRRHMLLDEADHYLSTGVFRMELDDKYQCPSHGVYIWVFPQGADHPSVYCSVHGGPAEGAEEAAASPASPTTSSPATTAPSTTTTTLPGKEKGQGNNRTVPDLPDQAKPPDHARSN